VYIKGLDCVFRKKHKKTIQEIVD